MSRVLQNREYQMPGNFLVQRLRPAELGRILEIEHACFRKDAYDRKLFAEYLRKCGEYFLVARRRRSPAAGGGDGEAVRLAAAGTRSSRESVRLGAARVRLDGGEAVPLRAAGTRSGSQAVRLGAPAAQSGGNPMRPGRDICGYSLTCPCRDAAELVSVAVDPTGRREGAASALMDSTLLRLKRHGITRLTLTVRVTNRSAMRFYKKYGFTTVKIVRGYYEDGGDGWRMEKRLR